MTIREIIDVFDEKMRANDSDGAFDALDEMFFRDWTFQPGTDVVKLKKDVRGLCFALWKKATGIEVDKPKPVPREVMCVKCGIKPSTGEIIAMCDECFEYLNSAVDALKAGKSVDKEALASLVNRGVDAHAREDGFRVVTGVDSKGEKIAMLAPVECQP